MSQQRLTDMLKSIIAFGFVVLMIVANSAWSKEVKGKKAENIIVKGKIKGAFGNVLHVVHKGRLWYCLVVPGGTGEAKIYLTCTDIR